jgi:uncharacterized GH25 family protein
LTPELVKTYLDEVRAPAAVRQAWSDQQAKGVAWQERYRKYMRVEHSGAAPDPDLGAIRRPGGAGLELLPVGSQPVRVGQPTTFRALSDGKPLSGLSVELVNERLPVGIWRQTDADGLISASLPFAGQWLLRATDFELPASEGGPWRSRFSTLSVYPR